MRVYGFGSPNQRFGVRPHFDNRDAGSNSIGVFQDKSICVWQIGSIAQLTHVRFLRFSPTGGLAAYGPFSVIAGHSRIRRQIGLSA